MRVVTVGVRQDLQADAATGGQVSSSALMSLKVP